MSAELPPLPSVPYRWSDDAGDVVVIATDHGDYCTVAEARERILQARIAELEAVLAAFDERWLMDGELGFCVACGTSIEGGEAHKPDCWITEARAAIDAARGAK